MIPKKVKNKRILYCAKCGTTKPFKMRQSREKVVPPKKFVEVAVDTEPVNPEKEREIKEAFLESFELTEQEDEEQEE
jgi:DNA-directed RNA polymerase subunit M/transcription elongation factor TFIIS